jgi:GxxExxY protein
MNVNARESKDLLIEAVVGAAYEVSNVLGAGFLEKVYERALLRELTLRGLMTKSQVMFPVVYKGQCLGEYVADLVVEDRLIVELKCVECFSSQHLAQCINYLKASGLILALLINLQKPKVEWRRVAYSSSFTARKIKPINLRTQDEVALGEPRDLVRVVGHLHAAPAETDVGVMALFFGDIADAIDERQRALEIGEQKRLLDVMLLHDAPIRQFGGDLREILALESRHASAARHAMPRRQVASRSTHTSFIISGAIQPPKVVWNMD